MVFNCCLNIYSVLEIFKKKVVIQLNKNTHAVWLYQRNNSLKLIVCTLWFHTVPNTWVFDKQFFSSKSVFAYAAVLMLLATLCLQVDSYLHRLARLVVTPKNHSTLNRKSLKRWKLAANCKQSHFSLIHYWCLITKIKLFDFSLCVCSLHEKVRLIIRNKCSFDRHAIRLHLSPYLLKFTQYLRFF